MSGCALFNNIAEFTVINQICKSLVYSFSIHQVIVHTMFNQLEGRLRFLWVCKLQRVFLAYTVKSDANTKGSS